VLPPPCWWKGAASEGINGGKKNGTEPNFHEVKRLVAAPEGTVGKSLEKKTTIKRTDCDSKKKKGNRNDRHWQVNTIRGVVG